MKLYKLLLIVFILFVASFAGFNYVVGKTQIHDVSPAVETVQKAAQQVLAAATQKVEYKTAPEYFELPASKWIPQTFNNCGPASTAMLLAHFGYNVSQVETKSHLRTGDDDKNIFMYQISDYLKDNYNIESKVFINGDMETVKTLIANGFYVMAEDWMHPGEDIGHVLIFRGYDDREGVLIADDSYIGVGVKYPYAQFDELQWKPFNREFMPVYLHKDESIVREIVGKNWDKNTMYTSAVQRNLEEVGANPNDMYGWFDLGMNYFGLEEYEKAKVAFEKSRSLGWPARMLWYQIEPVITYNKLGEYEKAIELANIGLAGNESFIELQDEKAFAMKALESFSN